MTPPDPRVEALHATAPLTDLHAHPALKAYLFGRNLGRHYWSGHTFDPFSSRSDFEVLRAGGVRVLWSSLHVPERNFFLECLAMKIAALLLTRPGSRLWTGKIVDRTFEMMDALERQAAKHADVAGVARSNAELDATVAAGKIALVHTVEGGHHLGGDLRALERLAARGVASMTLAHFFPNDIAGQVAAIPREYLVNRVCALDYDVDLDRGLTPFGRDVVREMMRLRMIVDVTHATPRARADVFATAEDGVPIVATHVGARALNPDPYNLAPDEIREIGRRGGAVGVIFMTYFLDPARPGPGLDALWRTIEHVAEAAGSFDAVALGTDFDGFTDPPDDLRDASRLPVVTSIAGSRRRT